MLVGLVPDTFLCFPLSTYIFCSLSYFQSHDSISISVPYLFFLFITSGASFLPLFLLSFFPVLGTILRSLHIIGRLSTTELHHQPYSRFILSRQIFALYRLSCDFAMKSMVFSNFAFFCLSLVNSYIPRIYFKAQLFVPFHSDCYKQINPSTTIEDKLQFQYHFLNHT